MPPSWVIKVTEGWGEPKQDSEGEDDGFRKKRRERGRGGDNTPARKHCSFTEPVHRMDGGSDWCGW